VIEVPTNQALRLSQELVLLRLDGDGKRAILTAEIQITHLKREQFTVKRSTRVVKGNIREQHSQKKNHSYQLSS
jgi:hypothetical protein